VPEKPEIADSVPEIADPTANRAAIKRWRLEELDPAEYVDWPKLVTGTGNYEARPPIPKVGSPGHDGENTGEGGLTGVTLTSKEQNDVPGSLNLWGFNLVASDKVNMDRVPADLRMQGKESIR